MQCFGIPFKPLGPKMTKTVSCSNTTPPRRARRQPRGGGAAVEYALLPSECAGVLAEHAGNGGVRCYRILFKSVVTLGLKG